MESLIRGFEVNGGWSFGEMSFPLDFVQDLREEAGVLRGVKVGRLVASLCSSFLLFLPSSLLSDNLSLEFESDRSVSRDKSRVVQLGGSLSRINN